MPQHAENSTGCIRSTFVNQPDSDRAQTAVESAGASHRTQTRRWMRNWITGVDNLVDLVCPPECVWCSQPTSPDARFCRDCRHALVSDYYRCQSCATPLPSVVPNDNCFRCRDAGWKFSQVITLGPYRGRLREAVILAKKRSFESLRHGLGQLLAELVEQQLHLEPAPNSLRPWIIPIPYHWSHALSRGAHSAISLARALGAHTGLCVQTRCVYRVRKTAKQGMLSWSQRKQNVRGAFAIRSATALAGRHIFLVDDVLTSGATAAEVSSKLVKAGASKVSIVVIARGTGSRAPSTEMKSSPS
ncbi:MAG: double zinc ribbon domain-containing protein [Pirellulaceae bacterium]